MIGAYDSKSGKIAVSASDNEIVAEKIHPLTVQYIEKNLGVKIGEFTLSCQNKAGACAEVNAADKLIRQNVKPEDVKFTDAYRPRSVYADPNKELKVEYVIGTCKNCETVWPTGVKK